ncbi:unnamed protein product [Pleuronectes platessa]|uniref:Uncharacterized protein n=1 Tax=Pleuronectes platessa TaxID=8262 RepID=A0A9N7V697_PLEPL|nr:unnamed protein product [Pleuronectes platessa]
MHGISSQGVLRDSAYGQSPFLAVREARAVPACQNTPWPPGSTGWEGSLPEISLAVGSRQVSTGPGPGAPEVGSRTPVVLFTFPSASQRRLVGVERESDPSDAQNPALAVICDVFRFSDADSRVCCTSSDISEVAEGTEQSDSIR